MIDQLENSIVILIPLKASSPTVEIKLSCKEIVTPVFPMPPNPKAFMVESLFLLRKMSPTLGRSANASEKTRMK